MKLTAENTAIVLDSTADFPEGLTRLPSWRIVPLYVRFGAESYRDYVDISPAEFYARLRTAEELPTTSQPTPADFLAAYGELEGYERVLSLHLSSKLSGTFGSASRAASDTGTASCGSSTPARLLRRSRCSRSRSSAGSTGGRPTRRWTSCSHGSSASRGSSSRWTRSSTSHAAGGSAALPAGRASSCTSSRSSRSRRGGLPVKRVRGNRKAIQEFANALEAGTDDKPGLRVGIAHAEAPERMAALEKLVRDLRPQAELEIMTTLGPVLGTHAGPGTVGLFWLSDPS